ncbi:MAG: MraY family glycosyltransferase [Deltaproteobacteria bacterium]|jgi:UDP-GlcNAc:undecaprenyl-phosphate GlcNAc-1-phosphate transferase
MRKILWQTFLGILLLFLMFPWVKSIYFNAGLRWQYILVFSFVAAYFATPFCRALAVKAQIVDKPDWRKIHYHPTPLLGGVAVYVAFTTALLLNGVFLPGMKVLLLGATLIFAIGLVDDIHPLPALLKLVFQVLISFLVVLWGDVEFTFFYHASWAPLVNIPLTVVWIVGLTNAMNFFDGLDGLATSLAVICAFFLGIIAFNTYQPAIGWFAVALLGTCLGFLPYNFRMGKSALLFLGDAGSTFMGFTLAGLAVLGQWSTTSHFVSLSAPILIFGVLIFDMAYVNLSRIKNRQARNFLELLTCVNRDHLHHRLLFLGFAHKEVVLVISTMSVCLGMSAVIIMHQRSIEALLGLLQAALIIGLIVTLMLKGRDRTPKEGDRRIFRRRREDRMDDSP